ncbi:glycosyltransferase [Chitinasiproducens palmae]|uniref:Glycosyltransferase, MGT family n=1 Tax=Chitinasiproducens palmae TaxID=1770053 RepID=A0A1H2PKT0_9BURK|nr:nucleotide disphospho-sugar-binding domain-containing protein [Chitinasiproducens palmae]SDV47059.1 glycosyltransferase, MGT family [Chitinasiproducens palmae]
MTRILFCVVPEKGHINPCIGTAQCLRSAGFEVAFYAPADITAQLDGAGGFTFLGPREVPERHDLSRGASFAANIRDAAWLRHWIRTLLIDLAPAQVDVIRNVVREWRPDIVVIDPLLYAAAIAAAREGLPWVALSNSLNPVLPDDLDSALLRTVRWLAPARERLFTAHGLTARFNGCDVLSPHLTIAFATEALVGPPPGDVQLVGPAMPHGPRGDEMAFPWDRLDGDAPLVYMSLGSQLYYHPVLFQKVIDAVRPTAAQLVLSVGELVDTDLLPTDDPRVVVVRYAPQLAMLRRAAALITHGGANSVMEALACGVPMLISPFCNDQFHSAYFVEKAGAGHRIDLETIGVSDLSRAVEQVLHSRALQARMAAIRASYARDGSAEAARMISALASESRPATAS